MIFNILILIICFLVIGVVLVIDIFVCLFVYGWVCSKFGINVTTESHEILNVKTTKNPFFNYVVIVETGEILFSKDELIIGGKYEMKLHSEIFIENRCIDSYIKTKNKETKQMTF